MPMTPQQKSIVKFMQKYQRLGAIGFTIIWWFMIADSLLLVPTVQFHWFRPFWSAATGHIMLLGLTIVSLGLCLWQTFLQIGVIYFGRHRKRDAKFWPRLITSIEICLGFMLYTVWGFEALAGHSAAWPLILLASVWVIGTFALLIFFFIQARQKSKVRFRLSSGNRPISGK